MKRKRYSPIAVIVFLIIVIYYFASSERHDKYVKEPAYVDKTAKQEFGLGADMRKYIIGEDKEYFIYRSPISKGVKGRFPKKCPEGHTSYINPDTGEMGWVPEDIEIPDGYVLVFDTDTGRFTGKRKRE